MALNNETIGMISAVAIVGIGSLSYWFYGDYKNMKNKHKYEHEEEHESKGGKKSRNNKRKKNNKTKKYMK